jgi:hypothetical protein
LGPLNDLGMSWGWLLQVTCVLANVWTPHDHQVGGDLRSSTTQGHTS